MSQMQQILSGMHSSQWFDHFRGSLYPLSLQQCTEKKPANVKSLLQTSADFIVKDSTMTLNALNIMPQELCTVLMKQAIEGNKDRAVDVLLTKWPMSTLSLHRFAPNIFTSLGMLHDHMELTRVSKQGLTYTTCVAHNFLETLKKRSPTKLKFVDLSGFPTAEVITYYLATHCMLAHNEARQNMMIRKYEEAIKSLPREEAAGKLERFNTDQSLPDDRFAVKLDIFISSEPSLFEVAKALKVSGFKESTLRLIVNKLDVTCLGVANLEILLEQVKPEYLQGLRLKYNSLSSEDFIRLSPNIMKFTNVTALDLSCNVINLCDNDRASDSMADLFYELPHLCRLDLSNSRLRGKLRRILTCVRKPLQYLRVTACALQLADITYLSVSHHTENLQELDISENTLGTCLVAFTHLLKCIQNNVCILELEDTCLTDNHCVALTVALRNLHSLMYLNMLGNSISKRSMCGIGESIAGLSRLQYLCVSYPMDCHSAANDEGSKKEFARGFGDVVHREQTRLGLPNRIPNVVFSDLHLEADLLRLL